MVGPRVYHVHQTRRYASFANSATAFQAMNSWLQSSDFKVRRKSNTFSRGHKRGVHVNFIPKFKLLVEPCNDGSFLVKFDYYGKMKVGTLVVVGILTSGISTAVGVATYAMRLLEADDFAASFWAYVDSLARGGVTIVKTERWGHDGSGNYVLQPVPVIQQPAAVIVQQQPYAVPQPYMVPQPYPVPYPQQTYGQPQPPMVKTREATGAGYPGNYSPSQAPPQGLHQSGGFVESATYSPEHSVYGLPAAYYPQTQYTQPPPAPQTPQLPHQQQQQQYQQQQQPQYQQQQQQDVRLLNEQPQMYYPVLDAPSPYYANTVDANASTSGYPQVSTQVSTTKTS